MGLGFGVRVRARVRVRVRARVRVRVTVCLVARPRQPEDLVLGTPATCRGVGGSGPPR